MFFIQKQRSMWIFYCCPNSAQKYKDAPCLQSCEILPDNSLCQRQHEACEVFNCPNRERRDESLLPVRASEKNDGMSTEWWDDRWTEPRERRRVAKVSHTRTHTKSFNAALCYLSSLFMRQWRECVWVCVVLTASCSLCVSRKDENSTSRSLVVPMERPCHAGSRCVWAAAGGS